MQFLTTFILQFFSISIIHIWKIYILFYSRIQLVNSKLVFFFCFFF